MKRSDFIRNSTLTAAGIGTLLTTDCNTNQTGKEKEKPAAATSKDDFEDFLYLTQPSADDSSIIIFFSYPKNLNFSLCFSPFINRL